MNDDQVESKVQHLLNQSIELPHGMPERLAAAREKALAAQRPEPAPALQWADNVLGSLGGWGGVSFRLILPSVLLVAGVLGIYAWQQHETQIEIEEIDAQLLTDDLPLEAYLDRGFQDWLKKRGAGSGEP